MTEFYVFLGFLNIYIDSNFVLSIIIFSLFLFVFNVFSIPGNLIFVASSGYFFGIYIGYMLSTVLGSLIFLIVSKLFLKKFFINIYYKYSSKVNKYISKSSIEYLILFRMIPGPPLIIQNLCLSILGINSIKFVLTSIIGFSPIIFIAAFCGSKIKSFESLKNISVNDILSRDFIIFISLIIFLLSLRIIFKKKN